MSDIATYTALIRELIRDDHPIERRFSDAYIHRVLAEQCRVAIGHPLTRIAKPNGDLLYYSTTPFYRWLVHETDEPMIYVSDSPDPIVPASADWERGHVVIADDSLGTRYIYGRCVRIYRTAIALLIQWAADPDITMAHQFAPPGGGSYSPQQVQQNIFKLVEVYESMGEVW